MTLNCYTRINNNLNRSTNQCNIYPTLDGTLFEIIIYKVYYPVETHWYL
jgi:hypothetical protein